MDVSHPLRGLLAPASAATLEVLSATTVPLTGREVHRLARDDVSLGAIQHALNTLVDLGLVTSIAAGRARLHLLNRDHLLARGVLDLVGADAALEAWLTDRLRAWPTVPRAAWLFGSVARGEAAAGSDIDLALIRDVGADPETWDDALMALAAEVRLRTGNRLEILDLTVEQLSDASRRGDAIVDELRRDARPLLGATPRRLLSRTVTRPRP